MNILDRLDTEKYESLGKGPIEKDLQYEVIQFSNGDTYALLWGLANGELQIAAQISPEQASEYIPNRN